MSIKQVYIAPCVHYRVIIKEWGCFARQKARGFTIEDLRLKIGDCRFKKREAREKRQDSRDRQYFYKPYIGHNTF